MDLEMDNSWNQKSRIYPERKFTFPEAGQDAAGGIEAAGAGGKEAPHTLRPQIRDSPQVRKKLFHQNRRHLPR